MGHQHNHNSIIDQLADLVVDFSNTTNLPVVLPKVHFDNFESQHIHNWTVSLDVWYHQDQDSTWALITENLKHWTKYWDIVWLTNTNDKCS